MKVLLILGFPLAAVGCDPARSIGISVAPQPAAVMDSLRERAFVLAEGVATRHGLDRDYEEGFRQCFLGMPYRNPRHMSKGRTALSLCGKATARGAEFRLFEAVTARWSPRADSVRRELMDSLRAQFGAHAVRECTWRLARDPRQSGCARPK